LKKAREIYEDIMNDEMDEGMVAVGQMMDEISAEEEGMTKKKMKLTLTMNGDEDIIDIDSGDDEQHDEESEDRLVSIEDKLDQLNG
jgi:hypothetical protein